MAVPSSSSLVFQQTHIHDDRRGGIITVNVLTLIIAYTAVLLRYLSRRLAGTSFGADDGWICVALVRQRVEILRDENMAESHRSS